MVTTKVWRSAEPLLRHLGVRHVDHIDLEAISHYCRADVRYERLSGCEARILGNADKAIITIRADAPSPRQRFSIAHELGHWMFDRGHVGFSCSKAQLADVGQEKNRGLGRERRANRFAADLLMPRFLFTRHVAGKKPTLEAGRVLGDKYRVSPLAATIRLVEHGSYPCMLILNSKRVSRWKWFIRHPDVPKSFWPRDHPGLGSVAYSLLHRSPRRTDSRYVPASAWFHQGQAERFVLHEDTIPYGKEQVLSLLWWEDQEHLIQSIDDE